jgi:hypothetical protein
MSLEDVDLLFASPSVHTLQDAKNEVSHIEAFDNRKEDPVDFEKV